MAKGKDEQRVDLTPIFDLIIREAKIVDGELTPAYTANVGIKDGRLETIGDLTGEKANRVIKCPGCFLTPGFIDIHSHSDFSLLINPRAESKVKQGVTTEVIGNCGSSGAPLYNQKREQVREQNQELNIDWATLKEYAERIKSQGTAVNLVPLTGQGNIRASVIGYEERPPTRKEMLKMLELFEKSIGEGSWGISTGLVYPPGVYSDSDELLELVSLVVPAGGIYATHMKNESNRVDEAVAESISLAKESGVSLQISHLKAQGKANWHLINECFKKIEAAREENLDIHCDRYPYTASSTDLDILLPEWVYRGGAKKELRRLSDPDIREKVRNEITKEDWDSVVISRISTPANKQFEGKKITEVARLRKTDVVNCLIDILVEEKLNVAALFFSLSPENLKSVLSKPYCLIGSDSSARAGYGVLGQENPHPRAYGTFPRFLHMFVQEDLMNWEEAIYKMTGLPARKIGLKNRGVIKEGLAADLVIFNPKRIRDCATYDNPHQYPEGIEYVIVNGEIVVERGEHTGKLPGQFLVRS